MEEDRIKKALKFSMILFEIMFFILVFWRLGKLFSFWWDSPLLRLIGIITGVAYLFLCPVAPACGIICGGLGYRKLKKLDKTSHGAEALKKWRLLSLIEIVLGVLTALPCMILFLGACSGLI